MHPPIILFLYASLRDAVTEIRFEFYIGLVDMMITVLTKQPRLTLILLNALKDGNFIFHGATEQQDEVVEVSSFT